LRKHPMNNFPAFILLTIAAATGGCDAQPQQFKDAVETASSRVRADSAAPLNADVGWAGAPDENVTVAVDRPFRVRFEVEAADPGAGPLTLQYRRNAGEWTDVEAHDFPYPSRVQEIEFNADDIGTMPSGWRAVLGDEAAITVQDIGGERVLLAGAGSEAVIGLYEPLWELDAFTLATSVRLPADSAGVAALVFGYVDLDNHWRGELDVRSDRIRLVRIDDGAEAVITEREVPIAAGQWIEFEVQFEDSTFEINFQDDALEFEQPIEADLPASDLGFRVPAESRAEFGWFVIEGKPSAPPLSIIEADGYIHGEPTMDLLKGATSKFAGGAGISLREQTPSGPSTAGHTEFEWPLVIRRFADGAVLNETGDIFEVRMSDERGHLVAGVPSAAVTLDVPPGHLGGTFVETPGRVGPWQAANGDLYFVMEPTESDNLFMMLKSTDGGRSWREVDCGHRPATGDLESVDGRQSGDTIHLVHQVTDSVRYHAFRTSDHLTRPDTWAVTDELAAAVTARAQMASLVVRSDGSLVAFYLGDTVGYSTRSPNGEWSEELVIDDAAHAPELAGPQAVLGAADTVHLAYYRLDGSIWYRRMFTNNTLSKPQMLAAGVGTSEDDFGSVLPLVYLPDSDTVVVIYRLADGFLWERRVRGEDLLTDPVRVTDRAVVQHAVDSQQAGADAVAIGDTVHVLFIDAAEHSIYSTHDGAGSWQSAVLQVEGIVGSWVRGNVYEAKGETVYGYVYDAGSEGGAGMNRFAELVLETDRP